jgi:hypothetical protein
MQGAAIRDVISAIIRGYPEAAITFVISTEALEDLRVEGLRTLRWTPLKNGRIILRL